MCGPDRSNAARHDKGWSGRHRMAHYCDKPVSCGGLARARVESVLLKFVLLLLAKQHLPFGEDPGYVKSAVLICNGPVDSKYARRTYPGLSSAIAIERPIGVSVWFAKRGSMDLTWHGRN